MPDFSCVDCGERIAVLLLTRQCREALDFVCLGHVCVFSSKWCRPSPASWQVIVFVPVASLYWGRTLMIPPGQSLLGISLSQLWVSRFGGVDQCERKSLHTRGEGRYKLTDDSFRETVFGRQALCCLLMLSFILLSFFSPWSRESIPVFYC